MSRCLLWLYSDFYVRNLMLERKRVINSRMNTEIISEIKLIDDIYIYYTSLEKLKQNRCVMERILNREELKRAHRFIDPIRRYRFIASHYILRIILGNHVSIEPELIEFIHSPAGKPILTGKSSDYGIHFSMAHSKDLAIYAISKTSPIGIDLEWIREMPDARSIARRYYTDPEYTALIALEPTMFFQAFLWIWIAKESILKLNGIGIAGLRTICVGSIIQPESLQSELPRRFMINDQISLILFRPAGGYLAAVSSRRDHKLYE